jgi:L-ascorbate metabolism protein UlaG (beta-lactamase superfamily)
VERRAALIRLDDVLHIPTAPQKPFIGEWYRRRMEKVLAEIEATKVTAGARVWKLYNHGWLIRTPSASWAYDVVPGPPAIANMQMGADWLARVARQADALFISHWHDDHANEAAVEAFLAAGKPVIAPEGLWKEKPVSARLTYPERSAEKVHRVGKLRYVAYPGHQGKDVTNNNHLVMAPEGVSTMQTGDQSYDPDFAWLDRVGGQHKVTVLLPNCWTPDLARMAKGVNPEWVITGHENEMAHTVPHREDFTQTYQRLKGVKAAAPVLMWGEGILISR